MYHLNFNRDDFLQNYWQKKPLVIANAFEDFHDPISADELAGMATEEFVTSRIVITEKDHWQIIQGPIEDFATFGDNNWQLLVQAVNQWQPSTIALTEAFRFIPDWRFDDLMVSFATPGGGVGPHIDSYDVFLVQGSGRRRWVVGAQGQYSPRNGADNCALIDDFTPIIDVILEPGDMLYIPPGFPHKGTTIETSMSYSIGFRAPNQQELFSSVADHLIDNDLGMNHFHSTTEPTDAGSLSVSQQNEMLTLLTHLLATPEYYQMMLGQVLSQNRFPLAIDDVKDDVYTLDSFTAAIENDATIHRIGGLKIIHLEKDSKKRLFINGESYLFDNNCPLKTLVTLANQLNFDSNTAHALCQQPSVIQFFLWLLNQGYAYLANRD